MAGSVLTSSLAWTALFLLALAGLTLLGLAIFRAFQRKMQPPPSVVEHRFWAFYRINDRVYKGANKKSLAWSQERFRAHRFRWQSTP
ncbi:MAG: hypothetical protein U1G07_06045 [Verrucomicrobiota bacterium]